MTRKLKNYLHLIGGIVANVWYLFPSNGVHVIGVTGTDGKTTTAHLIYHILKEGGRKVSLISTLGAFIGDTVSDVGFHVTTPSAFEIQNFMRRSKNLGNDYFVLEVTSHALDQNRVAGIHFEIGVLTNVTHEHLDYHKSFGEYLRTKAKLLRRADSAVINYDDHSFRQVVELLPNGKNIKTYGMSKNTDLNPKNFAFHTHLFGDFNTYNCLAAILCCRMLGIFDEKIRKALDSFHAPLGREDIVYDDDFRVMIDFAHTPNSFEKLLPEVRKKTKGRIIHVFGAAARRDTSKRSIMGTAAAKYDSVIILTSEDPRDEPVDQIMDEIQSGIQGFDVILQNKKTTLSDSGKYIIRIADRKKAIEYAVSLAKKGDFVLLTGKSHEKSMNMGNGEETWDEYKTVHSALEKRRKNEPAP